MMTVRGSMHEARKRRIWEAHGGRCYICREPVPMTGRGVIYDHKWQLAMGGPDDDDNIGPSHNTRECDKAKTARDAFERGKVRRLQKGPKVSKNPLKPGRGFDKTRSRGFDGKVRMKKAPKR